MRCIIATVSDVINPLYWNAIINEFLDPIVLVWWENTEATKKRVPAIQD